MKKTLFAALPAVAAAVMLSGCCCDKACDAAPAEKFSKLPAGKNKVSASERVNKFFDVGPVSADIKLTADNVYPRGRKFPFSFYSVGGGPGNKFLPIAERDAIQKRILEGGVTMVGPQYELNDQLVELCKKGNVKGIYTVKPVVDGQEMTSSKVFDQWSRARKPVPWDKIKASIAEQVREAAKNPEIAWWDLTPEELRPWRRNEMKFIQIGAETIRANDPLKRPIMMYDPGHRASKSMATTCKHLDFVAKGMYTNYSGRKTCRAWNRYSVGEMVKARAMLKREKDMTILALPEMFQQPKKAEELKLIPTWVRFDCYSSLTSGAQGVIVFSARTRKKFTAWDAYMTEWLKMCKELTGPSNIGQAFLFGEKRSDLTLDQTSGPAKVTIPLKGKRKAIELAAVTLTNIAYDNMRYVFVVNSANEPVAGVVDGLPYGSDVKAMPLWGGSEVMTVPEGNWEFELPAYGVAGWVLYREK